MFEIFDMEKKMSKKTLEEFDNEARINLERFNMEKTKELKYNLERLSSNLKTRAEYYVTMVNEIFEKLDSAYEIYEKYSHLGIKGIHGTATDVDLYFMEMYKKNNYAYDKEMKELYPLVELVANLHKTEKLLQEIEDLETTDKMGLHPERFDDTIRALNYWISNTELKALKKEKEIINQKKQEVLTENKNKISYSEKIKTYYDLKYFLQNKKDFLNKELENSIQNFEKIYKEHDSVSRIVDDLHNLNHLLYENRRVGWNIFGELEILNHSLKNILTNWESGKSSNDNEDDFKIEMNTLEKRIQENEKHINSLSKRMEDAFWDIENIISEDKILSDLPDVQFGLEIADKYGMEEGFYALIDGLEKCVNEHTEKLKNTTNLQNKQETLEPPLTTIPDAPKKTRGR